MIDYTTMSDDELNVAVAEKVMGWVTEYELTNDHVDLPINAVSWKECMFCFLKSGFASHSGTDWEIWQPTKCISHAWQVVERMREKGCQYDINDTDNRDENGDWIQEASFSKGGKGYYGHTKDCITRAICEAALKTVEKEE